MQNRFYFKLLTWNQWFRSAINFIAFSDIFGSAISFGLRLSRFDF
jgi:hypothetical protein